MAEDIQPIVLVGGRSRRYGRDKLREPWESGWLVDRPIQALAAVFGPRVAVVGACDPQVARRAHLVIQDRHPGMGPIGGIVSALEEVAGGVFVLPGDVPRVTADSVRAVLEAAHTQTQAWAVLAGRPEAPEPCFGVYRQEALDPLRRKMECGAYRLRDALPPDRMHFVAVPEECVANANHPDDLERPREGGRHAAQKT